MTTLRFACFAFLLGWLAAPPARAQRPLVQEYGGSTVLLASGDTLRGPLTLRRDQDVLLLTQPNGAVTTLSAVSVLSFAVKGERYDPRRDQYYYDDFAYARNGYFYGGPAYNNFPPPRPRPARPDTSHVRIFRTFRWNRGNDYSDFRSPAFFEQLSNGPRMLVRRESLVTRTAPSAVGPYGYGGLYGPGRMMGTYTDVKDDFFLATPEGNIIALRTPKKDLLAVFRAQARQIEQYAKDNKLSFTVARELAFIVNYANSLVK